MRVLPCDTSDLRRAAELDTPRISRSAHSDRDSSLQPNRLPAQSPRPLHAHHCCRLRRHGRRSAESYSPFLWPGGMEMESRHSEMGRKLWQTALQGGTRRHKAYSARSPLNVRPY